MATCCCNIHSMYTCAEICTKTGFLFTLVSVVTEVSLSYKTGELSEGGSLRPHRSTA